MVKLSKIFNQLNQVNVLVVGDLMLDKYTSGSILRISPEAPVPVLKVEKKQCLPGGSGNVILNLLSLGANVVAMGRVGYDGAGKELIDSLKEHGASTDYILEQEDYNTPLKNRLVASSQQIVRIDEENVDIIPEKIEARCIDALFSIIKDMQIIAISDYAKGFLSNSLISMIIQIANKLNIPVVVDPKGDDFSKYRDATIIKPNLKEAYLAANMPISASLEVVAKKLIEITNVEMLIITMSEDGIALFDKNNQRYDFPVKSKEVKDVTGAGDTVLSTLCYGLANEIDISHCIELANIAASIAVEHVGCARVYLSQLAKRLLENDANNKIFDEDHLYALKEVLKKKKFIILAIESDEKRIFSTYKTIKKLSDEKIELIIYIKDEKCDDEIISFLSSLKEVNYIILKKDSLTHLCQSLHPDAVYSITNGKEILLDKERLFEEALC
jgi:D-glycero-beta-D-manno-heptose-7-phosphate kinase